MEPNKIEILLEKYFEAETTVAEEVTLKEFFSQPNVPEHLLQYCSIFGYFNTEKQQKLTQETPLQSKKRFVGWMSIAASVVVLIGVGTFSYFNMKNIQNETLGKFESPEAAFEATQLALSMLSENVNVGVSGATQIQEFDKAKNQIFITN